MDPHPIGLFDSGVGGLTVWQEVARLLPNEDLIYFADQAYCPYGARTPEEIRSRSLQVTQFLLQHSAKAIVVACNTASAAALDLLRENFPTIPFVGMEPAIKPAVEKTRARKVGVLATRGTLDGDLFGHTRARVAQNVVVITQTAEGLVEQIEAGEIDSPETERLLRRYIQPMRDAGVDSIVLGCTHYPFVAPLIRRIAGENILLIDPSAAVAVQVERVLKAHDVQNDSVHVSDYQFYTTGDVHQFETVMKKLIHVSANAQKAAID